MQGSGELYYKGKQYHIGRAFKGDPVGLKESEEDGLMDVYYCRQKILKLDLDHNIE